MTAMKKTTMRKPADHQTKWVVIDGANQVVGRMASKIAMRLMGKHRPDYTPSFDCGDGVIVVNCEKAILTSDVGINPTNDGKVMRLVFPSPTEERRKQLVKDAMKMGEEAKVAVRNIRRDAMEQFKKMEKDSTITEDDRTKAENTFGITLIGC